MACPHLTDAERDLVLSTLPMVERLARRYARRGRALTYDDLYMEGVSGLIEAAPLFDPARGVQFSTFGGRFAWRSILHAIRAEVRATTGIPAWRQEARAKARRLAAGVDGFMPVEHVARELGCSVEEARDLLDGASRRVEMDETPEGATNDGDLDGRMDMGRAIERLTPLEREAVRRTYFEEQTVEEAAAALHLEKRVYRRILRAAHGHLRAFLADSEECPCEPPS